ncbi:MAG: hypothetical protein WAS27_02840 [Candidatus Saccharimonadales bacterium]
MATNHTNNSINSNTKKQSALEKFHLAFEYNRTWSEAKQSIQLRPPKK